MVEVTVKYGLITIYKSTLDLCDHAKEIDMECPVAPGKLILKKAVDIPKPIPAVSIKLSVLKTSQIMGVVSYTTCQILIGGLCHLLNFF